MNTRRIAALCLTICTGLALAACNSSTTSGSSTPPTGAAAKDSLMSSIGSLSDTSYAVSLTTPQFRANGAVDPVRDEIDLTAEGTHEGEPITIEALTVSQDSWAKIDFGAQGEAMGIIPSKWLRLDPLELRAGSLPFDQANLADAFDIDAVLRGIITVNRVDSEHYSGTIDLSGVQGVNSIVPAGTALGTDAKDLPFTATTDAQGRLTDLAVGTGGPTIFDFGISDYGAAAPVNPPDDIDVIRAPATAYPLLRDRGAV